MRRINKHTTFGSRFSILLAAAAVLFAAVPARAQVLNENEIKAGFLTRFFDFVDWPEGRAEQPAVIGVIGSPVFLKILEGACAKERLRGREVRVLQIDGVGDLDRVRVVFVVSGASFDWPEFSSLAVEKSVLVVGDVGLEQRLTEPGAMIQFKLLRNKIRFSMNLEMVHEANLVISSKLARLAEN